MMGGMGGEELYKGTLMPNEEEEGAGVVADPFEMMGGMGGEELYKVTLMPNEEEEGAGDAADPFDMMGGMGGEELYKVTLMPDGDGAVKDATKDDEKKKAEDEKRAKII